MADAAGSAVRRLGVGVGAGVIVIAALVVRSGRGRFRERVPPSAAAHGGAVERAGSALGADHGGATDSASASVLGSALDAASAPDSARVAVVANDALPPLDQLTLTELQDLLDERMYPLYEARFAAGLYVVLDTPVDEIVIPEDELVALRRSPDGVTVQRTTLPEAEHPEVYAIWREIRARKAALAAR